MEARGSERDVRQDRRNTLAGAGRTGNEVTDAAGRHGQRGREHRGGARGQLEAGGVGEGDGAEQHLGEVAHQRDHAAGLGRRPVRRHRGGGVLDAATEHAADAGDGGGDRQLGEGVGGDGHRQARRGERAGVGDVHGQVHELAVAAGVEARSENGGTGAGGRGRGGQGGRSGGDGDGRDSDGAEGAGTNQRTARKAGLVGPVRELRRVIERGHVNPILTEKRVRGRTQVGREGGDNAARGTVGGLRTRGPTKWLPRPHRPRPHD